VAKGARKTPSRFGYALEPLSRSRFVYYEKADRDLHLLSKAEVIEATGSRMAELQRLAHAQAALELVDRLVWGEEPHARLYSLLVQALQGCAIAPLATLPAVTLAFQLQLAGELGYKPRLDQCAVDGRPVSQRACSRRPAAACCATRARRARAAPCGSRPKPSRRCRCCCRARCSRPASTWSCRVRPSCCA
jgi:DNA repair protein RecO (recombination protein O)